MRPCGDDQGLLGEGVKGKGAVINYGEGGGVYKKVGDGVGGVSFTSTKRGSKVTKRGEGRVGRKSFSGEHNKFWDSFSTGA